MFTVGLIILENIVQKLHQSYPYYHRQYKRVPTVDQCAYGDHVCIFEANEQFLRDRFVYFVLLFYLSKYLFDFKQKS